MNYLDDLARAIYYEAEGDKSVTDPPTRGDYILYRAYALLALAKGLDVTDEDVHNAWAVWAAAFYPTHPNLVPFEYLQPERQALDTSYREAIRRVVQRRLDNPPPRA